MVNRSFFTKVFVQFSHYLCAFAQPQQVQTKRQDKLLFVGLHVLINLAEEVSTERKMVKLRTPHQEDAQLCEGSLV